MAVNEDTIVTIAAVTVAVVLKLVAEESDPMILVESGTVQSAIVVFR